jgi:2-succinyl-5-enolpyruvyl-6-hydroxy-3-cyclohexene-1-carboxylate synthase
MERDFVENAPAAGRAGLRFIVKPANANYLHSFALLSQLAACGVRRVVLSPGARCTPLSLAAVQLNAFDVYTIIDERSAGFFALGLSKADRVPAVLICTSGTAAANYFPAVIEAAQSHVPLILLTADRPAAARHTGAAQTIDQTHLYGNYARYFAELPPVRANLEQLRDVRQTAAAAFLAAMTAPAGPAQINVPFDDPLAPIPREVEDCERLWHQLQAEGAVPVNLPESRLAREEEIAGVAARLGDSLCGLMVAGPGAARNPEEADAIFELAKQLGWPLLADIASGLRFFRFPVMAGYDVFLRESSLAELEPDVVLALGALPTSKSLNQYLARHRSAYTIRIQPDFQRRDPDGLATEVIVADPAPLCRELARRVKVSRDSLLWDPFQRASNAVRVELDRGGEDPACEGQYVREAVRTLPDGGNLVLANSLSVRYADALAFAEGRERNVFVMRGANGIDGTISHAAGIAVATRKATLLVTGDLAFLHDLGGLLSVKRYAPDLTILVLNNNGGGIFHFLDLREVRDDFERIHGTPHDVKIESARDLFGIEWQVMDSPRRVKEMLERSATGPRVLEVRTEREANHRAYDAWMGRLTAEVAQA